MLRRLAEQLLLDRLATNPAAALVGPRQVGKTTLARAIGRDYYDLESERDRVRLDLDWDRVAKGRGPVVLDEAQAWPELFPRLRGTIDAERSRNGRFLLTGSVSPALMRDVTESLAGRLALVELTPFVASELPDRRRAQLWLLGGFPAGGILGAASYPSWQRDYVSLLCQRDLPIWGLSARPQLVERLLRMIAALHGQRWNASEVGKSLGVSYHTVNDYLDWLEGAFLVRRLLPFAANLSKRLVKAPKVYLRDSGLLHALLGVTDRDHLIDQPWVGASFEGFAIEQILGTLSAGGWRGEPSCFRTSDGYGLDLVLEHARERLAIEIKLTTHPTTDDLARVRKAAAMIGATRSYLITRAPRSIEGADVTACDLDTFLATLRPTPGGIRRSRKRQ